VVGGALDVLVAPLVGGVEERVDVSGVVSPTSAVVVVMIEADDGPAGDVDPSSAHAVTATSAKSRPRRRTEGVRRVIGRLG
jgi:hypothetical protein